MSRGVVWVLTSDVHSDDDTGAKRMKTPWFRAGMHKIQGFLGVLGQVLINTLMHVYFQCLQILELK
jgi:hypothetical protein